MVKTAGGPYTVARMARDPAEEVRKTWERLARTQYREFFVASHPLWRDPGVWKRQIESDVTHYLTGIDVSWLARQHLLDVGCGVGRLAPALATRAATYTGIDIASPMVEEARRSCGGLANARFLVSDGISLPEPARDRRYGLALAAAVFIHCPRDVVEATVRSVSGAMAPGGIFRMQLHADPKDFEPSGPGSDATSGPAARVGPAPEPVSAPPAQDAEGAPPPEALELVRDLPYVGHAFTTKAASDCLRGCSGAEVTVHRLGPLLLYASIAY
jgi:SAM-dependent methyltransferase